VIETIAGSARPLALPVPPPFAPVVAPDCVLVVSASGVRCHVHDDDVEAVEVLGYEGRS